MFKIVEILKSLDYASDGAAGSIIFMVVLGVVLYLVKIAEKNLKKAPEVIFSWNHSNVRRNMIFIGGKVVFFVKKSAMLPVAFVYGLFFGLHRAYNSWKTI